MNYKRKFTVGAQALVAMSMVAALVAACGSGPGPSSVLNNTPVGAGGTTLKVTPMKGPFIDGTIQVLDGHLALLGTGTIGANGVASVSINTTTPTFPLTLQVLPGAHYWNELTNVSEVIPTGSSMRSLIPDAKTVSANAVSGVAITPITELAVRHLENKAGAKLEKASDGGTLGASWTLQLNASPTQFEQTFAQSSMAAAKALATAFRVSDILEAPELPKQVAGKFQIPDATTPERQHSLTIAAIVKQAEDERHAAPGTANYVSGVTAASSILEVHEATYGKDATATDNLGGEQTKLANAWTAITSGASSVLAVPTVVAAPVLPVTTMTAQVQTVQTQIVANATASQQFIADGAAGIRNFNFGTLNQSGLQYVNPTGFAYTGTTTNGVTNLSSSKFDLINKLWTAVTSWWTVPNDQASFVLGPNGWVPDSPTAFSVNADGTLQIFGGWSGTAGQAHTISVSNLVAGNAWTSVVTPAVDANLNQWQIDASGMQVPVSAASVVVPAGTIPAGARMYSLMPTNAFMDASGIWWAPQLQDAYVMQVGAGSQSAFRNSAGTPVASVAAFPATTQSTPVCFEYQSGSGQGVAMLQIATTPGAFATFAEFPATIVPGTHACSITLFGGNPGFPYGQLDVMPAQTVNGVIINMVNETYPVAGTATGLPLWTLAPYTGTQMTWSGCPNCGGGMGMFVATLTGQDNALHVGWFFAKGSLANNPGGKLLNKAFSDGWLAAMGLPPL